MSRTRNYSTTDAKAIEKAYTIHALATTDLSEISAFDATIDQAFLDQLKSDIITASKTTPDHIYLARLKGKTNEVGFHIKLAGIYIKEVKFFAGKAFKDQQHILDEFGFSKYRYNHISQSSLIEWMQIIFATCKKYQTELINTGMNIILINNIEANITNMINANQNQETFILQRGSNTVTRSGLLNMVWEKIMQINKISKIIYAEIPEKLSQYVVSDKASRKSEGRESCILFGNITDSETHEQLQDVEIKLLNTNFSEITDEDGEFSFDELPTGTYDIEVKYEGYTNYLCSINLAKGDEAEKSIMLIPKAS